MRKSLTQIRLAALLTFVGCFAALAEEMTVWRSSSCGCCKSWASHIEASGITVKPIENADLMKIKKDRGVTPALSSCHTALVAGYTIEGHMPTREINRLLSERPDAIGLAVPGMPAGSPGMGSSSPRYEVLLIERDGSTKVFASYP